MKVLDLFAGLCGWSNPFAAHGHEVFSIDLDSRFDVSLHADILDVKVSDLPWKPDIILASPPCEGFSVMNIGRNWTHTGDPKTTTAQMGLQLVAATLALIDELLPTFWILENPRDKLRVLPIMDGLERRTVTYCHYGEERMKPTDLWGRFPPSLVLEPTCRNGDLCHLRAPRGSKTGTQGYGSYAKKSLIPYPLADAVRIAAEFDLLMKGDKG